MRRIRGTQDYKGDPVADFNREMGYGRGMSGFLGPRRRRQNPNSYLRRQVTFGVTIALALFLIGGAIVTYPIAYRASAKQVTLTVNDKGSVVASNGDSGNKNQYRVYTNKGVYVVADSFVFFNWRAADRYANLQVGHTYQCKQAGWRVGIMSWFPNLISCEEVASGS